MSGLADVPRIPKKQQRAFLVQLSLVFYRASPFRKIPSCPLGSKVLREYLAGLQGDSQTVVVRCGSVWVLYPDTGVKFSDRCCSLLWVRLVLVPRQTAATGIIFADRSWSLL